MTALYWIEVIVYGITAVVAGSLALTVVGAGPKQGINRSFALFMLAEAVSAMPRLFLRLDRGLGLGIPLPLAELVFLTIPLRGPLLMMFVTSYIGRRTRRNPVGAFKALAPRTVWVGVGAPPYSSRREPTLSRRSGTCASAGRFGWAPRSKATE